MSGQREVYSGFLTCCLSTSCIAVPSYIALKIPLDFPDIPVAMEKRKEIMGQDFMFLEVDRSSWGCARRLKTRHGGT